jgi:hypothetical protein
MKDLFDQLNDAPKLILGVRDVVRLGIRRDDDARNSDTQSTIVFVRRCNVIITATPVVPEHHDSRTVPIGPFTSSVDYRRNPGRARRRSSGMIGISIVGNHPRDGGKLSVPRVCQYARLRRDDIMRPVRAVANSGDHAELRPQIATGVAPICFTSGA